jgi:hypothetical protein
MTRRVPGLEQTLFDEYDLPDGFYLVRVQRIFYRYNLRHPYFWLRLTVLEPKPFAGRPVEGRLFCTKKALWKLSWFLRDFGYDPERISAGEVDERAVVALKGIVHISHFCENGRRKVNLAGFACEAQWEELSSLLPPTSDIKNSEAA